MVEFEEYTVFRSPDDGEIYAIRHEYPRLTAKYLPGDNLRNIEIIDIRDEWVIDPTFLARLMYDVGKAIADFIQEEKQNRNNKTIQ
jgi:hypothetical protein